MPKALDLTSPIELGKLLREVDAKARAGKKLTQDEISLLALKRSIDMKKAVVGGSRPSVECFICWKGA